MANHFVKASFVLTVTEAEAEVLRQIEDATPHFPSKALISLS